MPVFRQKLLFTLIQRKTEIELDHVFQLMSQGFDVAIKSDTPEVLVGARFWLEQTLEKRGQPFHLLDTLADIERILNEHTGEAVVNCPFVLLTSEDPPVGTGFVVYCLPDLPNLMPPTVHVVAQVLNFFQMETYLDVFDAPKMTYLKAIASELGIAALIDTVVQTAYIAGFLGDDEKAVEYLSQVDLRADRHSGQFGEDPIVASAGRLFRHALKQGHQPHCFLKAALSYYVVSNQGHSMTQASRVLNISRTTLQEHLRLAEKLGVPTLLQRVVAASKLSEPRV